MAKQKLTTKEQVLIELEKIYDMYKDKSNIERISAYIQYFVDNYSYDYDYYNTQSKLENKDKPRTKQDIEEQLLKLLVEKKGVCEQFSQALAILSRIDYEKTVGTKDQGFIVDCLECSLGRDGEEIAHEINAILSNNDVIVVDISSAIHAKCGDWKEKGCEDYTKFVFVQLVDYMRNLQKYKMQLLPLNKDDNTLAFYDRTPVPVKYYENGSKPKDKAVISTSSYYDFITSTVDEIIKYYTYSVPRYPKLPILDKEKEREQ